MGGLVVRRSGGCEIGRYGGLEQGTPLSGPRRRSKKAMEEGKEVSQRLVRRAAGLTGGQVKLSPTQKGSIRSIIYY